MFLQRKKGKWFLYGAMDLSWVTDLSMKPASLASSPFPLFFSPCNICLMDIMSNLDPELALGLGGMEIIAHLVLVCKINFSTLLRTLTGSVISTVPSFSCSSTKD